MRELHLFAGDMKTCTKCKAEKPKAEFYKNRSQKDGLANQCAKCAKEVQRGIYAANPEKARDRRRNYINRYRDKYNASRKANRWNIYISECVRRYHSSRSEIEALLKITNCEICGRKVSFAATNVHERPNIDHNHSNNQLRGLLCGYCNNVLGRAQDNPQTLIKAAQYLDERGYKCIAS
jgi:hypothetical protein